MGKDVSQTVAYQTVWEQLQVQSPDLPELFDFLIIAGVGQTRTHTISNMLLLRALWTPTKRQLRVVSIRNRKQHPVAGSSDKVRRREERIHDTQNRLLAFVLTQKLGGRRLHGQC